MSEEPKRLGEPMYSDKKWGIIIILVAIGLIVLTVCTNFFSELSAFGPVEENSGENIVNAEEMTNENKPDEIIENSGEVVETNVEERSGNTLRIHFD
ncbi:MAG: hypothetical protein IKI57_03875 [Clostridia bacterium]|nr:hypothetical protein [Clostridia bacterium]